MGALELEGHSLDSTVIEEDVSKCKTSLQMILPDLYIIEYKFTLLDMNHRNNIHSNKYYGKFGQLTSDQAG